MPPIQFSNESSGAKKKELSAKKPSEPAKSDPNYSSLMPNRAFRDYTNLKYSDPNFYNSPKTLDNYPAETDLEQVLKRSESMSPRVEQDWVQLSGKFKNEVIDIGKLSASSLGLDSGKSCSSVEKNLPVNQRQTELTLSGGGAVFLKSNKVKDDGQVQGIGKAEEGHWGIDGPDRLKSILRDKGVEEGTIKFSKYF